MDALHFCIDGNFHFNLKPKHTDPKDFPLTKGAAYFAHEDDFKTYIAKTKPYPNEVSFSSLSPYVRFLIVVASRPNAVNSSPWEGASIRAQSQASSR